MEFRRVLFRSHTVATLRALMVEKDKGLQMLWDYLGRSTNDEDKSFSAGNYEGTYGDQDPDVVVDTALAVTEDDMRKRLEEK